MTPSRIRAVNPFLMDAVRQFRPTIASVFTFSFFINLLTLAVPLYLLQIYSKVLPSGNADTLAFLTGMALVAILALGALEAIRRTMLAKAGVRFENLVSEHLLNSAIQRALVRAEASVNVMRDLGNLRSFVSGSSMLPLLDLPWTPLFLLILFLLHPWLGAIGLAGALLMLGIAVANERLTRDPIKAASRENRDMIDNARGYVGNADVIQAMGMQKTLLSRWNARNARAMVSSYQAGRLNTRLASISKMVRLCLQIAIICMAAWLIMREQLTAGATIASVLLMRRAISPIEQSIKSWKSVISARKSFHDISEYLDHASTLESEQDMPAPVGPLKAERVSYRVPGSDRSIFSRANLVARPGKLTAIVGPTAAGKSTLLRLLAGFVAPRSGRVTLGGFDIDQWSAEQRGPHIGYLPQSVNLFEGSVGENIARMADAPIAEVIASATLANAHTMIQAFPDGYDTHIAADGANLSGGQQQKIGLARAVFGMPRYLLLDEPDANLDADGRSALRKTIRTLRDHGIAIVAITHHTSLEKLADRVYRVENGRVSRVERAVTDPSSATADELPRDQPLDPAIDPAIDPAVEQPLDPVEPPPEQPPEPSVGPAVEPPPEQPPEPSVGPAVEPPPEQPPELAVGPAVEPAVEPPPGQPLEPSVGPAVEPADLSVLHDLPLTARPAPLIVTVSAPGEAEAIDDANRRRRARKQKRWVQAASETKPGRRKMRQSDAEAAIDEELDHDPASTTADRLRDEGASRNDKGDDDANVRSTPRVREVSRG